MKTEQRERLENERTRERENTGTFDSRQAERERFAVWSFGAGASFLPEGKLRIALQFTAGKRPDMNHVPEGRMNPSSAMRQFLVAILRVAFGCPFGTRFSYSTIPPLK